MRTLLLIALSWAMVAASGCGSSPDPEAATNTDGCDQELAAVELWPADLVGDHTDDIRGLSRQLTQLNPHSCQPMTPTDPLVDAAAVGAVAVAAVEHHDPYVRIDLFAYESAQAADDAGAKAAIVAAATDGVGEGHGFEYASPRPYLKTVTSWADPDATGYTPSNNLFDATGELQAAFEIALFYGQTVFGQD